MDVPLAASSLSGSGAEALRAQLLIEMAKAKKRFCTLAADLTGLLTTTPPEVGGLDRGLAALHLYEAQERIEDIEDALLRIAGGRYGGCAACSTQISLDRLKASPRARLCAACAAATAPSPRWPAAPRPGPTGGGDPRVTSIEPREPLSTLSLENIGAT